MLEPVSPLARLRRPVLWLAGGHAGVDPETRSGRQRPYTTLVSDYRETVAAASGGGGETINLSSP